VVATEPGEGAVEKMCVEVVVERLHLRVEGQQDGEGLLRLLQEVACSPCRLGKTRGVLGCRWKGQGEEQRLKAQASRCQSPTPSHLPYHLLGTNKQ
jgi:hypothetical protein